MTTKLLFWLYCYQYIYIWKLMKTFLWALNLVKLSFQQKKEIVALDKKKVNLCPGSKISTQIMSHFTIFVANHDKNLKNNRECELLWKLGKNCVKNLFCWVSICARSLKHVNGKGSKYLTWFDILWKTHYYPLALSSNFLTVFCQ